MANIRLDESLERRLEHLAKVTGRTKSYYIRKVLQEAIEDLEDLYIARHRMETQGKTYTSEEMRKELGLDH